MRQIQLWATDAGEPTTKSCGKSAGPREKQREATARLLCPWFRSPQPPFQDSNGRITRIFLPTHCLRSCRRPCGAGNHQSYRWWQDGPSSRSRTSRSHGSDPDLCQSSDRPDLPEKGRQFQLPGTRAAVSGKPSGSTARPLRVHCSLSAGTTDALKSPRLRQLARQGQYGGVGGTNAALLDKCWQAKHLEQGSDLAVCVVTTAICPSLAGLTTNPAQDVVTETGDGKGRSRGSSYSPLS